MKVRHLCCFLAALFSANVLAQTATYSIGFTVSGLVPSDPVGAPENSIEMLNNGGDVITVFSDGSFSFPTELADGAAYDITIGFQPDTQTCTVNDGSGVVASADVTTPTVTCDPPIRQPTPTAVPLMPLWLLGLMAMAIAGIASARIRRNR